MPYKDPEKRRAAQRAHNARWREKNREYDRERQAKWREAHRDKETARTKAWAQAHPEAVSVYNSRFRARRMGVGMDLTVAEWVEILNEWHFTCAYCQATGVPLTQEHMTPISRGGRHTRWNVVPACRTCNSRKSTRTAGEFITA